MSFRYVIVEDAHFIREVLKSLLRGLGGTCVGEVSDGENAVDLVQRTLPDLLILDLVLPKLNGIEVARQIREINREVKIIACSTMEDSDIIENALDAGCDSYLLKPFKKEEFAKLVGNYFGVTKEKIS